MKSVGRLVPTVTLVATIASAVERSVKRKQPGDQLDAGWSYNRRDLSRFDHEQPNRKLPYCGSRLIGQIGGDGWYCKDDVGRISPSRIRRTDERGADDAGRRHFVDQTGGGSKIAWFPAAQSPGQSERMQTTGELAGSANSLKYGCKLGSQGRRCSDGRILCMQFHDGLGPLSRCSPDRRHVCVVVHQFAVPILAPSKRAQASSVS
jgi:hypothetical protein